MPCTFLLSLSHLPLQNKTTVHHHPPHKVGGKPDKQREELAGLGGTQPNLRLLFIQSLNAKALE